MIDIDFKISVIGLGKVGLPLTCGFLKVGYEVIGIDNNQKVVESLNKGISHIGNEPGIQEILEKKIKEGKFKATTDFKSIKESNVIVVIVPLLLDENNKPDFTALIFSCKSISKNLKKNDLVCFETTLPPGTTKKLLVPILEESGLKAGKDFFVAACPERVMSGRVLKDLETYPKIIGGIDKKSCELAKKFYEKVYPKGIVLMSDCTAAEAVKVFEGVYRDVNIGLANELMMVCDKLGINVKEVIDAANTQPYCNIHTPGVGVGGHCIPEYPYFIINLDGIDARITKEARKLNEIMPQYFIEKLKQKVKNIKNLKVCILGLAYRPNVKTYINSPTIELSKKLKELGAVVSCYDPIYTKKEIEEFLKVKSYDSLEEAVKDNDVVIIATAYGQFKKSYADKIVIDGRFILDV